jgi:hypothetical protein
MNILITTTAFTALFCGAAFAQSSDIAHEAHRFVNNASAVSHVNPRRMKTYRTGLIKTTRPHSLK